MTSATQDDTVDSRDEFLESDSLLNNGDLERDTAEKEQGSSNYVVVKGQAPGNVQVEYQFSVTGRVWEGRRADAKPPADRIIGNDTVRGVTAARGVDDYRYTGDFRMDWASAPLRVCLYLNGARP